MSTSQSVSVLIIASAGAACSLVTDSTVCDARADPALTVDVRDSLDNGFVGQGARVIARDGEFADTAESAYGERPAELALERPGTYLVTVDRAGYRLWSRSDVRVSSNECGVRTVGLRARLQR